MVTIESYIFSRKRRSEGVYETVGLLAKLDEIRVLRWNL